jgi:hypothetical protein
VCLRKLSFVHQLSLLCIETILVRGSSCHRLN